MTSRKSFWARFCAFLFHTVWLGYLFKIVIWLSQGVNTLLGPILNGLLLLEFKLRKTPCESGWRFGFPDETLSSVFVKNRHASVISKGFAWVLNKTGKGHTRKAMALDGGRQFEAKTDE